MDLDEFERRRGRLHRYSTIIFVPHARARFRKLRISHRFIFFIVSLTATSVFFSLFLAVNFFTSLRHQREVRNLSTVKLERELAAANVQVAAANHEMAERLRDVDALMQRVLLEQRTREHQLEKTRAEYESLKALTEGQEKIAEAHRAILKRESWKDRLTEIGLGFSLGVLSSLVSSMLWLWFRSRPLSDAEAAGLDEN